MRAYWFFGITIPLLLSAGCGDAAPRADSPAVTSSATTAPAPIETLIEAAKVGDIAAVRRILDEGTDPNAQTKYQEFALIAAVLNRQDDVVALLLERGADPSLQDIHGQTALFMAANERDVAIAKMLLAKGADVDTVTKAGETALLRAVFWRDQEMVDLLMTAGAQPDTIGDSVLAGIGFTDPAEWTQHVHSVRSGR